MSTEKFRNGIAGMYDNLGRKIKTFAQICFVVESVLVLIAAIILFVSSLIEDSPVGLLILVAAPLGVLIVFVASWPIYWAGELLERVCKIEENTSLMASVKEDLKGKRTAGAQTTRKMEKPVEGVRIATDQHRQEKRENEQLQAPQQADGKEEVKCCPSCGVEVVFDGTECAFCGAKLD